MNCQHVTVYPTDEGPKEYIQGVCKKCGLKGESLGVHGLHIRLLDVASPLAYSRFNLTRAKKRGKLKI